MFAFHPVPLPGPRNNRAAEVAKTRLAAITPLAQQEITNSIGVNGFPSMIYKKLVPGSGHVCSCSKSINASPSAPMFDEAGNATQEHIASLLEGSQFGIMDYARQPTQANQSAPLGGPETTLTDPATLLRNPNLQTSDPSDPVATDIVPESDEGSFEVNPGAYENGSCSVCYGTGVVGGFQLYGGQRIVIENSFSGLTLNNVTLDQTEAPHQLIFYAADAAMNFNLVLPYGAILQRAQAFLGRERAPVWLQIQTSSGWQPFDFTTAAQYMDGLPHSLRAVSGVTQEVRITHIEIQLYQIGMIPIEFPHLSRTGDLSILDPVQDVQLYIPPSVPYLYPGDIVADAVYGKLWRLKTTQYNKDSSMRNMAFECEARFIQPYEYLSDLWVPSGLSVAQVTLEPRLSNQNPSNTIFR